MSVAPNMKISSDYFIVTNHQIRNSLNKFMNHISLAMVKNKFRNMFTIKNKKKWK